MRKHGKSKGGSTRRAKQRRHRIWIKRRANENDALARAWGVPTVEGCACP
jgi:hypothetical protein